MLEFSNFYYSNFSHDFGMDIKKKGYDDDFIPILRDQNGKTYLNYSEVYDSLCLTDDEIEQIQRLNIHAATFINKKLHFAFKNTTFYKDQKNQKSYALIKIGTDVYEAEYNSKTRDIGRPYRLVESESYKGKHIYAHNCFLKEADAQYIVNLKTEDALLKRIEKAFNTPFCDNAKNFKKLEVEFISSDSPVLNKFYKKNSTHSGFKAFELLYRVKVHDKMKNLSLVDVHNYKKSYSVRLSIKYADFSCLSYFNLGEGKIGYCETFSDAIRAIRFYRYDSATATRVIRELTDKEHKLLDSFATEQIKFLENTKKA